MARKKRRRSKPGASRPRAIRRASKRKPKRRATREEAAQPGAGPRPIGWRGAVRKRRPVREPFVFGPRSQPKPVEPLREPPPAAGKYDYGFPPPERSDAYQDEGGEGAPAP